MHRNNGERGNVNVDIYVSSAAPFASRRNAERAEHMMNIKFFVQVFCFSGLRAVEPLKREATQTAKAHAPSEDRRSGRGGESTFRRGSDFSRCKRMRPKCKLFIFSRLPTGSIWTGCAPGTRARARLYFTSSIKRSRRPLEREQRADSNQTQNTLQNP